ncbi:MAG: NAD(P)H-binding protein [Woeseiaceae bacterium]
MKIAVIGATGFVGSHVVDALMTAGHEVSVLVRPGSDSKLPRTDIWRTTPGDINDQAALASTLQDCDGVVYSVGLLREFPNKGITFENTQFEGVVNTVAAAEQCGARRFVLISANGVKIPGTRYQETKLRAEQHLADSGLNATVLRPSVIFGDPDGRMEFATQLYRDMVAPPIPAIGFFKGLSPANGPVLMSPAWIGDITAAVSAAFDQDATIGKTYALGGPEVLSWTEMIRRIAAVTGKKKIILPMPIGIMKLAATLLDWLPFFPVTRDQLTMLAEDNTADPSELTQLAGRPPAAFDESRLAYLTDE